MSSFNIVDLPNLVINAGSSSSNAISLIDDAYGLSIQAPATLTSTQVQILVATSSGKTSAFAVLQSGGSNVVLSAGAALVISPIPFRQLQLLSTVATEAATRTFAVAKVMIA